MVACKRVPSIIFQAHKYQEEKRTRINKPANKQINTFTQCTGKSILKNTCWKIAKKHLIVCSCRVFDFLFIPIFSRLCPLLSPRRFLPPPFLKKSFRIRIVECIPYWKKTYSSFTVSTKTRFPSWNQLVQGVNSQRAFIPSPRSPWSIFHKQKAHSWKWLYTTYTCGFVHTTRTHRERDTFPSFILKPDRQLFKWFNCWNSGRERTEMI